jgi:tetratricopeptide (TPR) repeat protein
MLLCLACGAEWDDSNEVCPTDGTRLVPRLEEQTRLGPYKLLDSLGGGGMARVYRALAPDGQIVALKVLYQRSDKYDAITRFDREGQILASLAHPHVVRILDAGEADDGSRYLAMELLHGEDLSARLKRTGALSLEEVSVLAAQILDALDAIHTAGIVHRDLKPSNIWLSEGLGMNSKLIDFGIARPLDEANRLTQAGKIIGTPAYLAPEQLRGDDQLDSRADIYSFAVTLFEALTGRLPIEAPDAISLMVRVASEDPTPPTVYRPDLPSALSEALLRALQKDPDQRYSSAAAFAQALAAAHKPQNSRRGSAELPAVSLRQTAPIAQDGPRMVTMVVVERAGQRAPTGFVGRAIEVLRAAGGMAEPLGGGRVAALFGVHSDPASAFGEAALRAVLSLRHPAIRIGVSTDPLSAAAGYDLHGVGAAHLLSAAAPGEIRVDARTWKQIEAWVDGSPLPDQGGFLLAQARTHGEGQRYVLGVPSPTVGRETELTRLRAAVLGTSRARRGRGFLFLGEDGVGKSRLLREARTLVEELLSDALFFTAHAEAPRREEPFGLFSQLLASNAAPPLLPGLPPPGLLDPGSKRSQTTLQDSLHAWLANLSGERPVCVLVEDLHDADPESLSVLARLLSSAAGPLLLLATARPELIERNGAGELVRGSSRIDLLPLEAGALVELLQRVLDGPPPEALVARVAEVSGGNPLLVEGFLRALLDAGIVAPREGGWALVGDLAQSPSSFEEMLGLRFHALPKEAQALLLRASVFGDRFPAEVLPALGIVKPQGILSLLEAREFLLREPDRDTAWYRFWHPNERQLWYETLSREDRAALHRGIGRWSKAHNRQDFALLAWHAQQGERLQKAARYHRDLAALSYARGSEEAALHHLNRSLEASDFAPEQFDLLSDREELLYALGRYKEAWQDASALTNLANELDDPRRRALALLKEGRLWILSDPEQARAVLEEALPTFQAEQDELSEATCHQLLGQVWFRVGDWEQSLTATKRALRMAQDLGRRALELDAVELLAELSGKLGDYARAIKAAERALALVRRSGDKNRELRIRAVLAAMACAVGRFETAESHARESLSLAREQGSDPTTSRLVLGRAQLGLGRADEAIKTLEDALSGATASPMLSEVELGLAEALFARGAPGDGARGASHASAAASAGEGSPVEALARAQVARWRVQRRDLDGAFSELKRAEEIRQHFGGLGDGEAHVAYAWHLALVAAGREEEAAGALEDASNLLQLQAERISDPELQRSYLNQIAIHREIFDALSPRA